MSGGAPLGTVEVEVRANLDKLAAGFAKGKAESEKFSAGMVTVNRYARQMEDAQIRAAAAAEALGKRQLATASAINAVTRATNPAIANTRLVSAAVRDAEKAYMNGAISAGALRRAQTIGLPWMVKTAEASDHTGRSILATARNVRFLVAAIGFQLVGQLGKFVVSTLEATASLKSQAAQLGLTTTELQEYDGIARQVGMSTDDMHSAFEHLKTIVAQVASGQIGPASKLFKALGVSITDAGGKAKTENQIFLELVDKLGQVRNAAQQAEGRTIAFGEAGAKMGELVKQGTAGIEELREAVRQTGIVLSDDQIQKADDTAKKLNMVGQVLSAKWSIFVVDNAKAIGQLADVLATLVGVALRGTSAVIGYFEGASSSLDGFVNAALLSMGPLGGLLVLLHEFNALSAQAIPNVANQIGQMGHSIAIKLPDATSGKKGPNIDLSHLLSPKGPKAKKGPKDKFDQFESDMAREHEQQLQLEHDATGNLVEQNRIDKQIIDEKLAEQTQHINRELHNKNLTAAEARQLKAAAATTASMEKEAADRKLREAQIEAANRYADELAGLEQDGLSIARAMARTDEERKRIDLAILDSKQQQAISEIDKEIALAEEAKDEERIAELTAERKKLQTNQIAELKQFQVEHLSAMEKFKNDLPKTAEEFNDAIKSLKFDLFNKKLEEAAQFAGDIGDAFGQAAGELAQFHNPLDVLKNLLGNLAATFTKATITDPVSEWAKKRIGIPAAKQVFGKDLTGPDALNAKQFDVALAQATGSLGALEAAAQPTSGSLGTITAAATPAATGLTTLATAAGAAATALTTMAASAGAGSASSGLSSVLGSLGSLAGGAGGGGGDLVGGDVFGGLGLSGGFEDIYGFAAGGYTGSGASGEVKGLVHANEFVMNSDAVSQHGVGMLSAMNSGNDPFAPTGSFGGGPAAPAGQPQLADAAAMLMTASQALLDAANKLGGGGGGGGGGFLGGLLGMLVPMASGLFGGGGKGLGGMLGGLFGGGSGSIPTLGAAGAAGLYGDLGPLGLPGAASGGEGVFGGMPGHDRNVLSANGRPMLRFSRGERFSIDSIASSRIPKMGGHQLLDAIRELKSSGDNHYHFGDIVVPGARDDRSGRQSGRQALSEIQRGLAQVTKRGLNR